MYPVTQQECRSCMFDLMLAGVTMKSQKEINLAKDLQLRDRQDIYRNFLLYCMSGDTIALPMGSTVVVERDQTEFARLSQLGDVLGLAQFEVAHVHSELAEQAYRQQVTTHPALLRNESSLQCKLLLGCKKKHVTINSVSTCQPNLMLLHADANLTRYKPANTG